MQTVHGSHHRWLVRTQDYKQLMKRRQGDLLLSTIPEDEYVVTMNGQYKCRICPHIPPFTSAEALCSHVKGKKHLQRCASKQILNKVDHTNENPSMAMPSLIYRTNEITKRVLSSNRSESIHKQESTNQSFLSPLHSTSEEPLWMQKMREEKEEREMIAKGFKKNSDGKWIRDEMVEFDSDEEPTL